MATTAKGSTTKAAPKKKASPGKYGPKASERVGEELHELKAGTLKSGSGAKVTSRKQAIAIGLIEARRSGAKVPAKKPQGVPKAK